MELLLTVTVIGILAAVFLAGAHAIRNHAEIARCSARIQNLNGALLLYLQDHNGVYPAMAVPEYGNAATGIWFGYAKLMLPYLGMSVEEAARRPDIFSCPMVRNDVQSPSYIFNGGNQFTEGWPGLAGKRDSLILHPSRTIALYELSAVFPTSWHSPHPGKDNVFSNAPSIAAFVDGHVAYTQFYWDGKSLSASSDPPTGFDYNWSGE